MAQDSQTEDHTTPLKRTTVGALISLCVLSPYIVGAINFSATPLLALLLIVLSVGLAFLWLRVAAQSKPQKPPALTWIIRVGVVICLLITGFDLIFRAFFVERWHLYHAPHARSQHFWTQMPLVTRYVPNEVYEGVNYGDVSRHLFTHAPARPYRFVTDAYGFRNEVSDPEQIDLLILGDSYGDGSGTSQDERLVNILAEQYEFTVYNLAFDATSPWQQYVNLAVEIDRLDTHEGTLILWILFSGNDLDDYYYPELDIDALPWRSPLGKLGTSIRNFRDHSPVSRYISVARTNRSPDWLVEETFLDGSTMVFSYQYIEVSQRTSEDIRNHPNYEHLRATLTATHELTDSKGVTLVIILAPSKEEVYSWLTDQADPWSTNPSPGEFAVELEALTDQEGLCFIDLKPLLVAESQRVYEESGDLLWWRDDTHWTPLAQQITAAYLVEHLCLDPASRASCCQP